MFRRNATGFGKRRRLAVARTCGSLQQRTMIGYGRRLTIEVGVASCTRANKYYFIPPIRISNPSYVQFVAVTAGSNLSSELRVAEDLILLWFATGGGIKRVSKQTNIVTFPTGVRIVRIFRSC